MIRDEMPIEWRAVPGYEGLYQVSNQGAVWSLGRTVPMPHGGTRYWPDALMQPTTDRYGYPRVILSCGGSKKHCRVHQLVARAFLADSFFDGAQVLHGDGDPSNNVVDNLRWGTGSANSIDSIEHGTHSMASKTRCPKGHQYNQANTYETTTKDGLNKRNCRVCARDAARSRARKRHDLAGAGL